MGYYDTIAKSYDELHGKEQLNKLRIIAGHMNVQKSAELLDVGCGSGLSARVFDCNITGVDPSQELLKKCSFRAVKAFAESLPFPDRYFDIVIAVTCIHNFDDLEKGLMEIRRVGKNNFALTVLKKTPKKELILEKIKVIFCVEKIVDEENDLILFCS